ncbi:MAG: putative nucleic-acid-binding protein [Caulobacteraceae bacterium]|nr:putative nucleic-acid-binding protein [Caulobacteraceae bacterium]
MNEPRYASERGPIRDGLLCGPLSDVSQVRLAGAKCATCKEISLGSNDVCPNCGSDAVEAVALGDRGTLWTYTIVRHKPPGDYRGPDPFQPFGMGLVELPDGIRVLAPLGCDVAELRIGLAMRFHPFVRIDADGGETVSFDFTPQPSESANV